MEFPITAPITSGTGGNYITVDKRQKLVDETAYEPTANIIGDYID